MAVTYDWDNEVADTLVIDTDTMEFRFKNGAVVYIYNKANSETLLNSDWGTVPANTWGFLGFASKEGGGGIHERQCDPLDASWDSTNKILTYNPCRRSGFQVPGTRMDFYFSADDTTGEITFTAKGTEGEAGYTPYTIDVPVIDFTAASVLIDAKQISRGDDTANHYTASGDGTINSPNAYCCIGTNCCFGAWSENIYALPDDRTWLYHYKDTYDHLVMHTQPDQKQQVVNNLIMYGGPYRFTTKNTWLDVAKAYRSRFEAVFTDAKKLWENIASWVRDVHCMYNVPGITSDSIYNNLATYFASKAKMVLMYKYSGEISILWGDHTNRLVGGNFDTPTAAEIATRATIRATYPGAFPMFAYYPWFRWHSTPSIWLAIRAAYIPVGYNAPADDYDPANDFTPDYSGTPTGWPAYWSSITANYDRAGAGEDMVHPGGANFLSYIADNYPGFCTVVGCESCLWDVLGSEKNYTNGVFSPWASLVNTYDFNTGTIAALQLVYENNPVGSESIPPFIIPYVYLTFEGARPTTLATRLPVNHPWRTALMGSYTWALDAVPITGYDLDINALLGSLPALIYDGDYQYDALWSPYFKARAKMFCDYEMFNNLPDSWGDATEELAYYRTNSTAMFKFVKRATGRYAYVNADNDAYILQHELKTGESTGHKNFADTYVNIPTVSVSSGTATNVTLTGFDYTVSSTGSWLAFGTQAAPTYSRGDYASLPINSSDLETPYTAADVTAVATDDDTTYVSQSASSQYAIHEFKNDATGKNTCTVTWDGQTNLGNSEDYPTILEIYNTSTEAWEELTRDTSAAADTDFTLSFPILSGLDNYKDTNGFITCRVYQSSISR